MKILCILLTVASMQISAWGFSQDITVRLQAAPLENFFKIIEQQSNYSFVYSQEALAQSKLVTIEAKNEKLENVLMVVFASQPLSYSFHEKFIIIKITDKKKETVVLYHDVTGRVVNENGEGVVATITEKGTSNAVGTDVDGYFQIKGVDENSVFIVTGVGIETMEIKVAGRSNIAILVKTKVTDLAEVIINKGYYSTSQKLNTGNVSKVTSEEISKQPITNPILALSGRVPGLYIRQFSGTPGRAVAMTLRGQNSLRLDGNDPLIIVDGVPFPSTTLSTFFSNATGVSVSPFSTLNPTDIENIEILKDADATAIYGSRGANGVILITTKKGKAGKTKVDINAYTGLGKLTRMMDLLNTQQYLEMRHEAFKNDGTNPGPTDYDINGTWDTTRYTDWQNVLIGGTARLTNVQGSISGGNMNTQFLIGGGYLKETTVFPGDFGDEKASLHFNVTNASSNKKVKTILSGSFLSNNNDLPQNNLVGLIGLAPNAPSIYDANGNLNWENETWTNPFSFLVQKHKSKAENLIGSLEINYEIFPGLLLKVTGGYNSLNFNETILTPKKFYAPSQVNSQQNKSNFVTNNIRTWIIEPQVNYYKYLWKGKIDVLIGTTFQETRQDNLAQTGTGFSSEFLMENLAAASSIQVNGTNYFEYHYNGLFGRINYNVKDKYLLNLTGRRDGSSRFGPGKQFANFGAIGAGWIFSSERFFQKQLKMLSYGKLRASYGITGSDRIADYGYLNSYNSSGLIYQGIAGLAPARLYNPHYAWESNKKLEAGMELGFFKDRLLFNVSYYHNRSSNQLVGYPLPATTGFMSVQYNLPAVVQNTGLEIQLNANNIKSKHFTWATSINLTIPKNKLVSYPNLAGSSFASQYIVGKSLFIQKRFHFTGVDPQAGSYVFEHLADHTSTSSPSSPDDIQGLKERSQNYFGGLQNIIRYESWELDFLLQFVKQIGENYTGTFIYPGWFTDGYANQPAFLMNRWRKPGDISTIQKFTQGVTPAFFAALNNSSSDNTLSDASFIRLRNISISYKLSERSLEKLHIQNCRFYIQGQNVFTITRFKGLDPESQGTPSLPPLRMLTGGIHLSF